MKAHTQEKAHSLERERGQSLVEMALILPFLLVLVVGIVEAGVALNRQLTVVNAAREGARFGAFGATPSDIHTQTQLATSDMYEFDETNSVIVVINAETNDDGTGFLDGADGWTETLYPEDATVPHVTQGEVIAELRAEGAEASCQQDGQPCPSAANLKLVVVDVRYDHESVLGLPFVGALAGEIPIGSWTAMRLAAPKVGRLACCALPIALHVDNVNWPDGWPPQDGHLMENILVGAESSNFGWLFWDASGTPDANTLRANLQNRCDAPANFEDACDQEDTALTPDSWITGATGWMSAVEGDVEALRGQRFPVPVWDDFGNCGDLRDEGCNCPTPGNDLYHIVGFALVEITEVDLTGASENRHISAKFRGWWHGCDE